MVYTSPRKMKLRITNGAALCEKKEAHAPNAMYLTSDAALRRIGPKLTGNPQAILKSYGCQEKTLRLNNKLRGGSPK